MVVSQLHFAKSAKDGPSISCTALQDSTSLPLLLFVRRGAKIVQGTFSICAEALLYLRHLHLK